MRRRTLINKKRREIVKERFDEFFFSVGYEWKSHDGFYFYYKRGEGKTDICVLGFAYSGAVEIKVSERLVTLDEVEQYVEKMYPDYKSYSDARTFYLDDLYWPTIRDTSLGNKDFLDWGIKTRFSTLNAIDLFCENYFTYYFETAQEVIENYSNLPRLLLRMEEYRDEMSGSEICPLCGKQADLCELIISRLCGDPNSTKLLEVYEKKRSSVKNNKVSQHPPIERVREVLENIRPMYNVLN